MRPSSEMRPWAGDAAPCRKCVSLRQDAHRVPLRASVSVGDVHETRRECAVASSIQMVLLDQVLGVWDYRQTGGTRAGRVMAVA